jgi:acyl carrier protein
MSSQEIMDEVNKIFIDVLENDDIILTRESSAKSIPEWDSLNHIQLVVAIEKKFKVRFSTANIQSWKNVGEMCDSIEKMLNVK